MGSAFPAEPREWYDGLEDEPVLFLQWPNDDKADLVAHAPHRDCAQHYPHRMTECGRFVGSSSNGRTPGSEPGNRGLSPCEPATLSTRGATGERGPLLKGRFRFDSGRVDQRCSEVVQWQDGRPLTGTMGVRVPPSEPISDA